MNHIVELILSLIDLIKAEINQSKVHFFSFLGAIFMVMVGLFFITLAFVCILASLGIALNQVMPLPVAILVTSVISILFGAIFIVIANLKIK